MHILTASNVMEFLSVSMLISAIERAACAVQSNDVQAPPRSHLTWRDNTFLTMAAVAEGLVGLKFVSIVPGNAQLDLPRVQGLMILSECVTGAPLALIDAASLTAVRTGALGAVALKYTTPPDVETIGIVGCGTQGVWQAVFACAVRPIKEVFCFNRLPTAMHSFADRVKGLVPDVEITPCCSTDELLSRTNVVIAATSSSKPVLSNERERLAGKHFVSVGSFKPWMQELPDAVYELAGQIVIDAEAARHEVGDVINPLKKGLVPPTKTFTLGQLIRRDRAIDVAGTTVFKSVGLALYDLYAAKALLDEAQLRCAGLDVDLLGIAAR
jgi:ornithine cyclodeaminase/alanine dehydrogenase-like protein (mu-crystallin family)